MTKLLYLFIIILVFSCKAKQPIQQIPVNYREVITTRLVPVVNPADSANITALFECDSANNVILKQLDKSESERIKSQTAFSNGKFNYKFKTVIDTVHVIVTDTVKSKDVPVIVNVPFEVNKLSGWQYFQIYCGKILLIGLLVWGAWTFIKPKLL